MEQEKITQILIKDNGEKTVHSFFFIRTILKEQSRLASIQKTFYPTLENRDVL